MLETIFTTKIYETNMQGYDDALRSRLVEDIDQLVSSNRGVKAPWAWGGLTTVPIMNFKSTNIRDFATIIDFIEYHMQQAWKQMGFAGKNANTGLWINSTPPGGMTAVHDHIPAALSSCFYVDADPESGALHLEDPMDQLQRYQPRLEDMQRYTNWMFDETIEVKSGKLVIWPAYLRHRSDINGMDRNRIIFGMDARISK